MIADTKIRKMGRKFKKVASQLGKKNRNEGKFIELARKKAFQKKRRTKRNILHMPLTNKNNESGKFNLICNKKRTTV